MDCKDVNSIDLKPIGNRVEIAPIGNSVDACLFSVTSEYFLLTQFQSYRHDRKVGDSDVDSH